MEPHNWGWYNQYTLEQFHVVIYQQKPNQITKLGAALNELDWVRMGDWFFEDGAGGLQPVQAWEPIGQATVMKLSDFVKYVSDNCDRATYQPYIITGDEKPYDILMMVCKSKASVHNLQEELKLARNLDKRPLPMALRCMKNVKVHPESVKLSHFVLGTEDDYIPLYKVEGVFSPEEQAILNPTVHITVSSVVAQDQSEVRFKIKRSTPMRKLMDAYCKRQAAPPDSVRFFFRGAVIKKEDTADTLNMSDNDRLEVFRPDAAPRKRRKREDWSASFADLSAGGPP